jgi:hypothetical protein
MNQQFNADALRPVTFSPDNNCNTSQEIILAQVAANIRRQLPQVMPYAPNTETVALVCGGPSLAETEKELVDAYWRGAKVVAVNGTYQWCIERNIKPSAMIMLDARQFNARFVETPVPNCKYLLASQCHPDAFEICKDRETLIWHCCTGGDDEYNMLKQYYFNRVFPIGDGTTVAIKAIPLMTMLGYKTFDIFGRDDLACRFECAPWHMQQAADFQKLVHDHGDKFRLNVRGRGLIAATMRIAALLGQTVTPENE